MVLGLCSTPVPRCFFLEGFFRTFSLHPFHPTLFRFVFSLIPHFHSLFLVCFFRFWVYWLMLSCSFGMYVYMYT